MTITTKQLPIAGTASVFTAPSVGYFTVSRDGRGYYFQCDKFDVRAANKTEAVEKLNRWNATHVGYEGV